MSLLDTVARKYEGLILLLGRLGIAVLYLPSGFDKLTHLDGFAAALAAGGVPAPSVVALAGACVEFFGSLAILLGFKARYAALVMAAFTLVAALVSHRYWELAEAAAMPGLPLGWIIPKTLASFPFTSRSHVSTRSPVAAGICAWT